jgi:FdhE protein
MPSPSGREKLHREADRRWARLARDHPELDATIAAGRGIVALYIDCLPPAPPLGLSPERAREKLAAGVPLLDDESLDLDLPAVRHFFARLCDWARAQPDRAADGEKLGVAVASGDLDAADLLAATLAGDDAALGAMARRCDVDGDLLRSLAGFLASAVLMDPARELTALLAREGIAWDGSGCPVCGGVPLLAEHQGSEGQRMLRCATCGAGWRFVRSRCVNCGTDDPDALHYLAAEGREEKYRVDLCDRCRSYLKSTTSFAPTPPELLAIEDAALLHLEAVARERGYHPTGRAD